MVNLYNGVMAKPLVLGSNLLGETGIYVTAEMDISAGPDPPGPINTAGMDSWMNTNI